MDNIELILVEDDPMVMAVNEGFIDKIGGFSIVATARTGQEALQAIQSRLPRLVILDIYLPDMDGVQVLKELRRMGIPTDVIMITAAHDVETVQDTLRLGVVDYIIKPFKFERIKAALDKYRVYLESFRERDAIDQQELDLLIKNGILESKAAREESLPKGLREITLQQVFNFLAESAQGLSAEEVAEGVGLARVTARRYLDFLERSGQVILETKYGSVGRPINKYRVTRQLEA